MNQNDMVYYKEDGNITAGGFKINSTFLSSGIPFAKLYKQQSGGTGSSFSSLLDGLAVPAGLLMLQQSVGGGNLPNDKNDKNDKNVINDALYDKLLSLASDDVKQINKTKNYIKKTKKSSIKTRNNKKTRKQK